MSIVERVSELLEIDLILALSNKATHFACQSLKSAINLAGINSEVK
jgi:hypothetical protein